MNAHVRAAGIPTAGVYGIVLYAVFRDQTDARANTIAVALCSDRPDKQPVVGCWADIAQNAQRPIELGENHVDAPIVVQVAKSRTAVHASPGKRHPGRGRDVGELSIAQIRKDDVALRNGGVETAFGIHHVAADGEEVFATVIVEVVNSVAPPGLGQGSVRQTACEGDLLETRLPQVAKQ